MKPRMNPIKAKFIDDRIDKIFPLENFYFFKIFKGEGAEVQERNLIEQEELIRLIEDNMYAERYFIKSGLLEPIHLTEEERDLLVDGMQTSITKIAEEVNKSKDISIDVTGIISDELKVRLEETMTFQQKFNVLLSQKPYTLQKCSLHGLILAKEIIAKARDETNVQCQIDLAK